MIAPDVRMEEICLQLESVIGKMEIQSPLFDFNFTEYYLSEMGPDLKKVFMSFSELTGPERLAGMKIMTNELEQSWMRAGKRRVNMDPGYVTSAKLVLATTKDFAHRVAIGGGIYGDVQLQFRHGKWRTNAWTFPDYRTPLSKTFFASVRDHYNQQERQMRNAVS